MRPIRVVDTPRFVAAVIFFPVLACLVLMAVGKILGSPLEHQYYRAKREARIRQHDSSSRLAAVSDRLWERHQNGELSWEEWSALSQRLLDDWEKEATEVRAGLLVSRYPDWLSGLARILILGPPFLIVVHFAWLTARLYSAWRLLGVLRGRGYTWLTLWDAITLSILVPKSSRRAPHADDFLVLGGGSKELHPLVRFLRRRTRGVDQTP